MFRFVAFNRSSFRFWSSLFWCQLFLRIKIGICLKKQKKRIVWEYFRTNSAYPDLRGSTFHLCASRVPDDSLLYICDPDRIFNATQRNALKFLRKFSNYFFSYSNQQWVGTTCGRNAVSVSTPLAVHFGRRFRKSIPWICRFNCARRQPSNELSQSLRTVSFLQTNEQTNKFFRQLIDRAESFCKTLEGRWALGDCGNSVIVFVWRHYKKVCKNR